MSGNNQKEEGSQGAAKFWAIIEKGIEDAQGVILANRQAFEEKIVTSNLERALGLIRDAIGMPIQGFEDNQEANLWLCGFLVPQHIRAERAREVEWWVRHIQEGLELTDNYQSAIRTYLFTGEVGSIEANAVVEVDFAKHDVRVIPRDHIRDAEKPFLQAFSEALLAKIGRTAKRFTLTNHRARDPQKHAHAMTALRLSKQKGTMKHTDMEIMEEILKDQPPVDSVQLTDEEGKTLSAIKYTRYNKLKREKK